MKISIESSSRRDASLIVSDDLTSEQISRVQALLLDLVLAPPPAPEEKDEILGVTRTVAYGITKAINSGMCNPYDSTGPRLGTNKINDIKYVRRVANCNLIDAVNFINKHIKYPALGDPYAALPQPEMLPHPATPWSHDSVPSC